MKKAASILALYALVLAACSGSGAVAATVNGTDITVGEVESLIDPSEETIAKDTFAQFLTFQIQLVVAEQAAEEAFSIVVSDEEVTAEVDRLIAEAITEGQSREDLLTERGITEALLTSAARQGLLQQAIRDELGKTVPAPTEEAITAEIETASRDSTEVCVSHILVGTEAEARNVLARLEAGERFGELATELSLDTGSAANQGVLPCGRAGGFVPEFRDASVTAPVGEVYDTPVQSQFGFHVIRVTDRTEPSPDQLPTEEDVSEGLFVQAVTQALQEWFLAAVTAADVVVDEKYGIWQLTPQPQVVPPQE